MSRPSVLVVEHDSECPPALFGEWLAEADCDVVVCRPWAGDDLPGVASYDGLVVLGGPMGADDDASYPWLGPVKQMIRDAAAIPVPTLGICLGHQLAAVALGGSVTVNPLGQQVGLLDVGWTEDAREDRLFGPLSSPRRGVQWNDDVVAALPEGATVLAATDRGEIQVARYAPLVWGVQLHPEVDVPLLQPWAESDRGSHETRGVDTDAVLHEIDAARDELDDAWRPLATGFAALVRERSPR